MGDGRIDSIEVGCEAILATILAQIVVIYHAQLVTECEVADIIGSYLLVSDALCDVVGFSPEFSFSALSIAFAI